MRLKCPHCKGELRETKEYQSYQYNCLRCRRGWKVEGDLWKAMFDAGCATYRLKKNKFELVSESGWNFIKGKPEKEATK